MSHYFGLAKAARLRALLALFLVLGVPVRGWADFLETPPPEPPCSAIVPVEGLIGPSDGSAHRARPGSMGVKYPHLLRHVIRISDSAPELDRILRDAPRTTARDLLDHVVSTRIGEANRLRRQAQEIERKNDGDEKLVEMLRTAGNELDFGAEDFDHAEWKLIRPPSHGYPARPRRANDPRLHNYLHGLISRQLGVSGELYAALLFPGFVKRGFRIRTLERAEAILLAGGIRDDELQKFLDKEVDVEWMDGLAWVEAKNYPLVTHTVLHHSQHGNKTMFMQAEENIRLAKAFGKQMHMYFFNGIARDAARELAILGIYIHGTVNVTTH